MKKSKHTDVKRVKRELRHERARKKIKGSPEKPRLCIFRGSTSLAAQVIDDLNHKTILGLTTVSKELKGAVKGANMKSAEKLGEAIAIKCREKNITTVVFDRGGNKYHGVVKVFAEAARKNGINF